MIEKTLSIIKPDAVSKGAIGGILNKFEKSGLRIASLKKIILSKSEAEGFYAVHKERGFFNSLTEFMCSGPVVALVLEGEDAIKRNREIMGATDPKSASEGTIRKEFGDNIERNAVHGSDSQASADFEIPYFFSSIELL